MMLGDTSAHVDLTVAEVFTSAPERFGDVRVVASVKLEGFAGAVDAWIECAHWTQFCNQLDALERDRRGEAVLQSMSPEGLRLRLHALDPAGHLGIDGSILRYHYGSGAPEPQVMHLKFGAIEFDPGLLPHLISELRAGARPA